MCKYDREVGVIPIKDLVYEDELSSWDNFF